MVSKNLILTVINEKDPDSQLIGIPVSAAQFAVTASKV
jgi:hypothetical protein